MPLRIQLYLFLLVVSSALSFLGKQTTSVFLNNNQIVLSGFCLPRRRKIVRENLRHDLNSLISSAFCSSASCCPASPLGFSDTPLCVRSSLNTCAVSSPWAFLPGALSRKCPPLSRSPFYVASGIGQGTQYALNKYLWNGEQLRWEQHHKPGLQKNIPKALRRTDLRT